jgi:hypothetical protein
MKKLILIALALASTAALAQQPSAFLVASYIVGRSQVCEYSDGSRFTISASARCAPVLY